MTKPAQGTTAYELWWLQQWPEFSERPATMEEFLGPLYLNVDGFVRPAIRQALIDIFGDEVSGDRISELPLAIITGAIGIGKTTVASIILPYMVHYVLCMKDPQGYYGLMPGSRIAFMQMSTSEDQALEVVFGDIKARIEASPWFSNHPWDPKFKNQLRFERDIWVIPGDSKETTFEGYNILGGILDEADSHTVTAVKDYAEQGYATIKNRIDSRFEDRGFMLVIGQMKSSEGFARRTYDDFRARDDAYALHLTIWESRGRPFYACREFGPHDLNAENPDGVRCGQIHEFAYDKRRKRVISDALAAVMGRDHADIIWIPNVYKNEFISKPEKALKDLAGIPPAVGDPFISLVYKIEEARDRWIARYFPDWTPDEGYDGLSPVKPDGTLEDWFKAQNTIPRVAHLDIAYSANGDALGLAMGHVEGVVDIDGELKPNIIIDMLYRKKAPAGGEIMLSEVRHFIYELRDGPTKFKLKKVTYDGFESTDTRQQLAKKRFEVDDVSVDKSLVPYYDLRDALYEDRIEFPPYMTHPAPGDERLIEIVLKEMSELIDAGKKIDHPALNGSKDVADCVAGVVFTLMGDRAYRKNIVSIDTRRQYRQTGTDGPVPGYPSHPAYRGDSHLRAPIPRRTRLK